MRRRELADALGGSLEIPTHMTGGELEVLYQLGRDDNRPRALELGSYLGASSSRLAVALSLHGGHLYCVDTWANETMPEGERDTYAEFLRNTRGVSQFITPIRKRTDEIAATDVELPLDLVFVDADHSYPAVKRDFEKVRDWLRDDGVLAFHDAFFFEAVSRVVGEILATGRWQLLGHVDNLVWLRKLGPAGFPKPMADDEYGE